MTDPIPYDKMFMTLYKKEEHVFARSLENTFDNPLRLLEEIYSIGFAHKERNGQESITSGGEKYNYWINAKGTDFIKNLPDDFNGRPYAYYQSILSERKEKELNNEALVNRINELTLEALQRDKENAELKRQLDEVGLKLSVAQHADIPKNAEDRKTVITWQIIAGVATAVAFLLKLFGVQGWL